jgi:nicotinate-nucleotide--dimethylbenzimidazole phosphoribosyltransferase
MHVLEKTIRSIKPLDKSYLELAQKRLDSLTKPPGSLGQLEEIAKRIVAIKEDLRPAVAEKVIITMAGDHGITEEGVSAYPQEVTRQMVYTFVRGGAAINVLARHSGARVEVVDMGVAGEFERALPISRRKVASGTKNFAKGPAMTRAEAIHAIENGIAAVTEIKEAGLDVVGTGDMGIGNTTPSSAMAAVFLGLTVREVTGKGAGLDDEALLHKIRIIEKGIAVNKPDPDDPIDVLSKVGGFEIGGIAGVVLGAASLRIPILVDGLISTAGAFLAYRLCPAVKEYLFSAHSSVEAGQGKMLAKMGLSPLLHLNMRLGEGTGAALAMGLIDASIKILNEMATFESAGVSEKAENTGARA